MSVWLRLLKWYRVEGRDLPWRNTKNPYAILVSEMMLQQTQVQRVLLYYPRWLKQFPNWNALAKASNADVIHAWAGLGYNRRALSLRDIAKQVAVNGEPGTYEGWLAHKGIGPYTAAAVSLFSGKDSVLPIDTNIRRVLGRAQLGVLFPQLSDDEAIRKAVGSRWQTSAAADIPQALFDLANTHCLKKPNCLACPLQTTCRSAKRFLSGKVVVPKRSLPKPKERIREGKRYPDRIYRGRILAEVREHPKGINIKDMGKSIDVGFDAKRDQTWVQAMVYRMIRDGLLHKRGSKLFLPSN